MLRVGLAIAVLVALVGALMLLRDPLAPAEAAVGERREASPSLLVRSAVPEDHAAPSAIASRTFTMVASPLPGQTTSTLSVRVVKASDRSVPVEGARVRLGSQGEVGAAFASRVVETDAEGKANFFELTRGVYPLSVGPRVFSPVVVEASSTVELELGLGDSVPVELAIVDPTGAPVPGASIWFRPDESTPWTVETTADSLGRARVAWADSGNAVRASAPDFVSSDILTLDRAPPPGDVLQLVLPRAHRRVRVGIVDPEGRGVPLATAQFVIEHPEDRPRRDGRFSLLLTDVGVSADQSGVAEIALSHGQFVAKIHAWSRGFRASVLELGYGKDSSEVLHRLQLAPGGKLSGQVTNESGEPVNLACVQYYGDSGSSEASWPSCRTDSSGSFELADLPPTGEVVVRAPGYSSESAPLSQLPVIDAVMRWDVRLRATAPQEFVLQDAEGRPLLGFEVRIVVKRIGTGSPSAYLRTSDPGGRFTIDDCPAGEVVAELFGARPGGPVALTSSRTVVPSTAVIALACQETLEPRTRVRGRLLLSDGSIPKPSLQVVMRVAGARSHRSFEVDPVDGSFDTGYLPQDRYVLTVMKGGEWVGWWGAVDRSGALDLGTWTIPEIGILDVVGIPSGCVVELGRDDLRISGFEPTSEGRGRWGAIPPGTYEVQLKSGHELRGRGTVDVKAGVASLLRCSPTVMGSVR